jgi:hypothetical protein
MPEGLGQGPESGPKIIVDSDWKAQVEAEKEALARLAEEKERKKRSSARPPLSPASFPILVSMLSTQALMALGHFQGPEKGEVYRDAEQAKHLIDLLQVIEDKTRGNLAPDEQRMLTAALHELRIAYVHSVPAGTPPSTTS